VQPGVFGTAVYVRIPACSTGTWCIVPTYVRDDVEDIHYQVLYRSLPVLRSQNAGTPEMYSTQYTYDTSTQILSSSTGVLVVPAYTITFFILADKTSDVLLFSVSKVPSVPGYMYMVQVLLIGNYR
jgi:hypothetical protein